MKKYYSVIASFVFVGTLAAPGVASFTIPGIVYRIDQLSEAKEVARDKGIPIVFIYSDESTDCGLATAASIDLFQGLKDYTVMVYVSSEDDHDWEKTPNLVRRAINSPQAGKYIPKAVIVDASVKRLYGIVPYVRDVNERKNNISRVRSIIPD